MHEDTRARITELMTLRGWKEPELAERSGVDQSTINRFRSGKTDAVLYQTLQGIAHAFGVTVSQLVGEVALQPDAKIQAVVIAMQTMPEYMKDAVVAASGALAKRDDDKAA